MHLPKLRIGLIRINPLAFSFVSGVFVSISANLFTGVFGGDAIPVRGTQVLGASALALLASCGWMYAGYLVGEAARSIERAMKGLNRSRTEAERVIVEEDYKTPAVVLVALLLSLASLATLVPSVEMKNSAPSVSTDGNAPKGPVSSPPEVPR